MKKASLLLSVLIVTTLILAGCSRPHHRMAHGTSPGAPHAAGEPSVEQIVPEVKHLVGKTVKDPAKAKQVEAILHEIIQEARGADQLTRGFHEQLNILNASYDTKLEQFTKVLQEMNERRMVSGTKILGLRFKIRDMLTPQEWAALTEGLRKLRPHYGRTSHGKGM